MSDVNEMNRQIIAEFRENAGVVGGYFEGIPLVILHSTGAKSGAQRLNPLAYQQLDDGWAIFASAAGAPKHPAWYHNVVAHPDVTIEVGTETHDVRARVATGEERDEIWNRQVAAVPQFGGYEESAGDRVIPVVVLEPR